MKKLIILGLIGAVAVVAIAKKTNAFSYASTFVSQVASETKQQIPTKFELERIRQEIAAMDSDISQMIRPVAEYKVVIERMRKDIAKTQTNVEEKKKDLLAIVQDLQGNQKQVTIGTKTYSAELVRAQVQRDMNGLKLLEKSVKTQQQVLEAKELSLKATQEQLVKVISKKREYELRLAQLEAEEETLQIARIGSDIKIDSGRATQIETALADLEHRQQVERETTILRTGDLANIPLHERNQTPVDLQSIRNYLEGHEPAEKTASNQK
jgi:predicted metal-dependent peptidase